jgi:hypothetical protein
MVSAAFPPRSGIDIDISTKVPIIGDNVLPAVVSGRVIAVVGAIVPGGKVVPASVPPPAVGAIDVPMVGAAVPPPRSGRKRVGNWSMEDASNTFSPAVSSGTACWKNNDSVLHPLLLSDLPDLDLEDLLQFAFDAFVDDPMTVIIFVAGKTNEQITITQNFIMDGYQ